MGLITLGLDKIPYERRGRNQVGLEQFLTRSLEGLPVNSIEVTPESALRLAAVAACTRILSTAVASLPLNTLALVDGTWQKDEQHYLYSFFGGKVNSYTTSYMWKQYLVTCLCLNGNAYSQILFNKRMQVMQLQQLDPNRMEVKLVAGAIQYRYKQTNNNTIQIPSDEVFHVRWPISTDGFTGRSPIQLGSKSIQLGLSTQEHTNQFFSNGATLGPVIKNPSAYDSEKSKQFEQAFTAKHQSNSNAHLPLFLYNGMEMAGQTINYEQLQLLELKKFSVMDIARFYGVPSHMLNESEPGSSKANVEQQAIEFATNTLKPLVENIEAELHGAVLSDRERQQTKLQFYLDSYTRADFATRTTGYQKATGGVAWLTPNDARAKENLPGLPGGDQLYNVPGSLPLVPNPDTNPKDADIVTDAEN